MKYLYLFTFYYITTYIGLSINWFAGMQKGQFSFDIISEFAKFRSLC